MSSYPFRPTTYLTTARVAALIILVALAPGTSAAQLRPLEPLPWRVMDQNTTLIVDAGFGIHHDQRASLAGTTGKLLESGNLLAAWRSGRIAIEAGGTVNRRFHDRVRYAEPHPTVEHHGPQREDSGDYNIGTIVRLTPGESPDMLALRFGTRLPNSNDRVGIDRDRADFYALIGGQLRRQGLRVAAEGGVGIFGSHDLRYEQADPLLYAVSSDYTLGPATLSALFLGHRAGFGGWVQRGNESRSELRLGAGIGHRHRLRFSYVHGLADHSPSRGWLIGVGAVR
ncbi:hypothetical protein BH23GEM6_BH23GEM6_01230 [soil metagenome]